MDDDENFRVQSQVPRKSIFNIDKVKQTILSQDMFGHPIMMNYNSETTFKTLPGGIISLFLNAFIVWFSITQVLLMIHHGNNTIIANETVTDFEKIGSIGLIENNNIPIYRFAQNHVYLKSE